MGSLAPSVRLGVGQPAVARQDSRVTRLARHHGHGAGHGRGRGGRAGGTPRRGQGGQPRGVARAGVAGRGRLTSVPADRLSSPTRTSRGRDRRRLNIAVRLGVGQLTVARQDSRVTRLARHHGHGAGHGWGRGGLARVTPRRGQGGRAAVWGGSGRGRLTSVPADRLSSPSRTSRGRDRRRLNIAVRRTRQMEGLWTADDLRRAFVAGAAWWEYHRTWATMWPSDRDKAEAEAERRFPGGRPPNNGFHLTAAPARLWNDDDLAGAAAGEP